LLVRQWTKLVTKVLFVILFLYVHHNLFLDLNEEDFEINEQADPDKLNENEDNELRQCGHQMCGVRLRQHISVVQNSFLSLALFY
jgi:hypothetical protein